MNLSELKKQIGYHPVLLGTIGLLASAALAAGNLLTSQAIVDAEQRDLETSLRQVLPDGFADNDLLADSVLITNATGAEIKVYRARLHGQFVGAVFSTSSRGYAGPINSLMGVDAQGKILGVRVVKHAETPGLGDKIELAKSDWILDFNGKSLGMPTLEHWGVKKDGGDFDQFAGATITPRAVVKSVREGLQFYTEHQHDIQTRESHHE